PLPAFMVTFANASFFGWWQGALLSWTSAMAGAAICFYLARLFGRGFVVKVATKTGLRQVDAFFERYGKQSILIARLLPFVSFGVVSYAGGLTPMALIPYMVATGIGQTPSTLIYSYVGGMLTGGARMLVSGLLILFALSILASVISGLLRQKSPGSSND
ncbi:MAG: VTT domain-containing protein, partial [Bacillota bacterium]|nr:VTT domain-containing protein [Bacillota bacterium]